MKLPKSIALLLTITLVSSNVNLITANAQTKQVSSEVLAGQGRVETAIEVSKKGWDSSEEVILVNDKSVADALAATPFADAKRAPILITEKSKINDKVKAELKRLGTRKVYLIGGEETLSKSIEEELKAERIIVDRISGEDRYKTSVELAKRLNQISPISQIAVVNGDKGLVDAASVGAAAANNNMPIILSHNTKGISDAKDFIKDKNISKSYVIGGENSISKEIEKELSNPKRISGRDRNETNAKAIEEFYTDTDLDNAYITKDGMKNESELIDSLAVGALASKNNSPIILVGNKLSESQKHISNSKSFDTITRVGGNGNEDAFKEIEELQKIKTYGVKTVSELNEAIKKSNANDIINFRPSVSVNESFSINTKNAITVNLYGTYTKDIAINMPNGDVVNNNSIENIIIDDIKDGTFINKGTVNNLVINDINGCSIFNDKSSIIKNIKVEENAVEVDIMNNGKLDKLKIEDGASQIVLDNKGSVSSITNNAEDTKIENSGTINKVDGTQRPVIDGNKPGGSTGGGGSNPGTEKPDIDESKILASAEDDRTIHVKMDELTDVDFSVVGNGYKGEVISSQYNDGMYLLKLDRSLGENCSHTLNINYDKKTYTKEIINHVMQRDDEMKYYFDGEILTIITNKDKREFKNIYLELYEDSYNFTYNGEIWTPEKDFEITSESKGKTTVISITRQGGFNNEHPLDVELSLAKIKYPDSITPNISINTKQSPDGMDISCLFDESIKIYDANNNIEISNLNAVKDRIKVYENIGGELGQQVEFKIDYISMNSGETNMFTLHSDSPDSLVYGSYIIELEDIFIEDFAGNKFNQGFEFKFGKSKEHVSTIEELKKELDNGTKQILMEEDITSTENLIIDEATNLIIPRGKELNADKKDLIVEGVVSGEGSISVDTNIKRARNGIVFKPEIVDVGNSEIEIKNISKNSIKSILIDETQLSREFNGVYTTTGSNMQSIQIEEVEDELNPNVRIKLKAGDHIENYPVVVNTNSNPSISGEATIETKITLEVDKSYLIGSYLTGIKTYDDAVEGTETGQYIEGSKAIYKEALDKANSVINDDSATQIIIDQVVYELFEATELFNISKVPPKATNMEELKKGLASERVLLVTEDINVEEDLTIRQNCTLIIAEGKTLNIKDKELLTLGRVIVNGNVTKDGTIKLGPYGVFDQPSIKKTGIDETSAIGITNIGISSIESIKIGKSEFNVGHNGDIYSTTNPEGITVERIENGPEVENEYNVNPVIYLKLSGDLNADKPTYKVVVTDVHGNKDEVDMPITFMVDKTKLIEEIDLAEDIYRLAVEGSGNGEFEVGSKDIYKVAIDKAKGVRDDKNANYQVVSQAINELKQATRAFRDKMVIPRVDNIEDLQEMLNVLYMEKVILTKDIENNTTLDVPTGVELQIEPGITLTNNGYVNINGLVSGEGKLVNGTGSIQLGEEGVLFKPSVEEKTINDTSAIKISNVGEKAIRSIVVDGVKFYKDNNGVYTTTGVNLKAIELIESNGLNDEGENNIQPNIYLTITSGQQISNCKVSVHDKYKKFEEIEIPLITVREN